MSEQGFVLETKLTIRTCTCQYCPLLKYFENLNVVHYNPANNCYSSFQCTIIILKKKHKKRNIKINFCLYCSL